MKALKNIAFFFFQIIISTCSYAQSTPEAIMDYVGSFDNYPQNIHISTNKTYYSLNDTIWFSVFLTDSLTIERQKNPMILCGLYDTEGNEIFRKSLKTIDGSATGRFDLPKKLMRGRYFVYATLDIHGETSPLNSILEPIFYQCFPEKKNTNPDNYYIEFFSESRLFLANANNTIFFKISDQYFNGYPIKFGEILDTRGDQILGNIKSDENGIGKFDITLNQNEKYRFRVLIDSSTVVEQDLPQPSRDGLLLKVNNLNKDFVSVGLSTNQDSWPNLENKSYYIAIHQNNKVNSRRIEFNEPKLTLSIPRNTLNNGISYITVFDAEFNPILQRKFLNNISETYKKISADYFVSSKDSVTLKLSKLDKGLEFVNTSIKVFASDNQINNYSYLNDFYLDNSKIDININHQLLNEPSASQRFKLDNSLIANSLDLIKLNKIKKESEKLKEKISSYLIRGKIFNENLKRPARIFMIIDNINNMVFSEIEKDGSFEFNDIGLMKGDSLKFGITDGEGKNHKPNLNIDISPKTKPIKLRISKSIEAIKIEESPIDTFFNDLKALKNFTELKSVEVTARINKKIDTDLPTSGIFNYEAVSEEDLKKYPLLSNYIRKLGFKTQLDLRSPTTFSILPKIRMMSPPKVIINGFRSESSGIYNYSLSNVREVSYEHAGVSGSSGGTIYINLKNGIDVESLDQNLTSIVSYDGFENSESLSFPEMIKTEGVQNNICWFGNATIHKDQSITIKFPHYDLQHFVIVVEGVSSTGEIISENIKIIRPLE